MKKSSKIMACAVVFTLLSGVMTSYAGEWKSDAKGWWYAKDGGYAAGEWIEDKGKWYYFDGEGYMVSNAWIGNYYLGSDGAMLVDTTTPDGYRVGADGAWIQDGGTQDTGYLEKYAEVLRNVMNGVPQFEYDFGDYDHKFQLVYVDGDTVPELVIFGSGSHSYHNSICLYTYYQGNVCMLRGFDTIGFSYVHQENWIKSQYIGSGSSIGDESFHTINEGKLVTTAAFSGANYGQHRINNNKVSRSEYESQLNAMKSGRSFIEINRDTTHELNEENIRKILSDMMT